MTEYDYFDRIFRILSIEDRLKFFFIIWKKGALKSQVQHLLQLDDEKDLKIVAREFQKLNFIEIITHKENQSIASDDEFYVVTDDNLAHILNHICDFASVAYTRIIFHTLLLDKETFNPDITERFQEKDLTNQIILLLLDRSMSLFFMYIIEQGKSFKDNDLIKTFFNDFMVQSLLTGTIRNIKLELLEKEFEEQALNEPKQEYFIVKPWRKNL